MFHNFIFDMQFSGDLYIAIMNAFEVTRSDAEGIVIAKGFEIDKLYSLVKTVEEVMKIVFNISKPL